MLNVAVLLATGMGLSQGVTAVVELPLTVVDTTVVLDGVGLAPIAMPYGETREIPGTGPIEAVAATGMVYLKVDTFGWVIADIDQLEPVTIRAGTTIELCEWESRDRDSDEPSGCASDPVEYRTLDDAHIGVDSGLPPEKPGLLPALLQSGNASELIAIEAVEPGAAGNLISPRAPAPLDIEVPVRVATILSSVNATRPVEVRVHEAPAGGAEPAPIVTAADIAGFEEQQQWDVIKKYAKANRSRLDPSRLPEAVDLGGYAISLHHVVLNDPSRVDALKPGMAADRPAKYFFEVQAIGYSVKAQRQAIASLVPPGQQWVDPPGITVVETTFDHVTIHVSGRTGTTSRQQLAQLFIGRPRGDLESALKNLDARLADYQSLWPHLPPKWPDQISLSLVAADRGDEALNPSDKARHEVSTQR